MDKPFFSIIIPAYNAAEFITDCLNSIFAQEFSSYEIIVINDGSSDDTLNKLKDFASQYPKMRIINFDHNCGAAVARNRGIDEAQGEYILFVDADDMIIKDLLKMIHEIILSSDIESIKLVVFGVIEEYFDRSNRQIGRRKITPASLASNSREELRRAIIELEKQTLYGYLWNKVYNTSYLRQLNIKIPNMRILEDIFFNIRYCQDIDNLIIIDRAPYTYKKRYGTATGRQISDYYDIHKERMELLINQYKSWGMLDDKTRQFLALTYTRYVYSALQRIRSGEFSIGNKTAKEWLEHIYGTDGVYEELIDKTEITLNGVTTVMYKALKGKQYIYILMITNIIHVTERWMKPLYLKLK